MKKTAAERVDEAFPFRSNGGLDRVDQGQALAIQIESVIVIVRRSAWGKR